MTTEISDKTALVQDPVVSVVMLAYRHEDYLDQAIRGVLSQRTEYPFELVIGEDCSPDATREIALAYQRMHPDRIRVLFSERNVGPFLNSQRTILATRGRYIAFCEGDDYWHCPEKLQLQVALMESDPGMTACHSDFDRRIGWRVKRNAHARRPSRFLAVGDAYPNALRSWTVMTATAMYRASMLREYMGTEFNRSDFPFGDYTKVLFASAKGRIGYIPRSLATWRKVRGSASNAGFRSTLRLRTAALECRRQYIARFPVEKEIEDEAIALAHKDIMTTAFMAGDLPLFLQSAQARIALGMPMDQRDRWRLFCMRAKFPLVLLRALRTLMDVLATWDPTITLRRWRTPRRNTR